jgi:hypothetical protein
MLFSGFCVTLPYGQIVQGCHMTGSHCLVERKKWIMVQVTCMDVSLPRN